MTRALPLLRLLDRLLQAVVRPRPQRLAWISDPDYIGNAFHLFRHAVTTRPDREHVWLVVDPAARPRIERDLARWRQALAPGATVRVLDRHSVRGYWAYLRSATVLHTHGTYPMVASSPRRQVVSLWHGMPIKCIGALNTISPNPHPTYGTLHLATSELFRYVIAAAFEAPLDRVRVTGLPRCDVLAVPHVLAPSRAALVEALDLPADRGIVLWMPSYRAEGAAPDTPGLRTFLDEVAAADWAAIEEHARRHRLVVVVKLHPHDPLNERPLRPPSDHLRFVRARDWLATGIELYDALAHVDGIISDVSSVLIDLLVTDTPIGILGFDPDAYTRDVVFPVAALLESSRIHDLADPDEMADFFCRAAGIEATPRRDDLSPWLSSAPAGRACEAVLAAVDL